MIKPALATFLIEQSMQNLSVAGQQYKIVLMAESRLPYAPQLLSFVQSIPVCSADKEHIFSVMNTKRAA
jgi:hypothetical protein